MDDVKRQVTQRFLYHFLGVGQEFQKYVNKKQGFCNLKLKINAIYFC